MDKLLEAIGSLGYSVEPEYPYGESDWVISYDDLKSLLKEYMEGKVLVDSSRLDSISDTLACIGNYGPEGIMNVQELCMAMAKELGKYLPREVTNDG